MHSTSLNSEVAGESVIYILSVHKVRWYNPKRGMIFSGHDEYGNLHVVRTTALRTKSIDRRCEAGEIWKIKGIREFYKGQDQILAEQCTLCKPLHGKLLVRYLKENFEGIGKERAQKLFNHFDEQGKSLVSFLDNKDVDSLLNVLTTRELAEQLVADWHDKMDETRIIIELSSFDLPISIAGKLFRFWGEKAIEVIKENPYFLLALVGWSSVDRLAHQLGIDSRDERRIMGAVEASLYKRLDEKHTLTQHVPLRTRVINLLNQSLSKYSKWQRAGIATGEKAIEISLHLGVIVGDRKHGYRTRSVAEMETYLVQRIRKMHDGEMPIQEELYDMQGAPRRPVWEGLQQSLNDGCYLMGVFEKYELLHHKLTTEQRQAVVSVIENQLLILKGGAGTGKTSVMSVVHDVVEGVGGVIHQMALSGRAKERMKEATGRSALTIAKFLREVKSRKIILQSDDMVIVDEASMIGLSTLYQIMHAMPAGARLLLVGDPGQLPPIEFGLTFHIMADNASVVPKVELTVVHRQAAATGIPQMADDIRHGRLPNLSDYNGMDDGVSFVSCSPKDIVRMAFEISTMLGGSENSQIIGIVKGREAGTINMNSFFHNALAAKLNRNVLIGEEFAVGDQVMYLENDVDNDLYNGTFGTVVDISADSTNPGLICRFEGKSTDDAISMANLYKLALAYAVTTHKAQGSQFSRVIIPILKSRLLDRTMLYTALTRARRQVVFIGDRALFEQAVVAPASATLREVGFYV
jgi:exodeoxyribonuclease V alpha subunit